MNMEDRNYENDPRVRAGKEGDWFKSFNETAMTATLVYLDDEGDDVEVDVPVKFGVCPTCDGKGTHVNPSIDCGGLSQEDFAEDPEFAEDYFSGAHDVQCYQCGGKRVVPEINEGALTNDQKKAVKEMEQDQRDRADHEAECHAERMMGA